MRERHFNAIKELHTCLSYPKAFALWYGVRSFASTDPTVECSLLSVEFP